MRSRLTPNPQQPTATQQSPPPQTSLGPDEFPEGYNPLTGQPVEDLSLLEPEIPLRGECKVRDEPLIPEGAVLGNRVWHDQNKNGVQDPGEGGVAGVFASLYDEMGKLLRQTSTEGVWRARFVAPAGAK